MKPVVIIAIAVGCSIAVLGVFGIGMVEQQEQINEDDLENQWNLVLSKAQDCHYLIANQRFMDMDFTDIDSCTEELHLLRMNYDIMEMQYHGFSNEDIVLVQEATQQKIEENNLFWEREIQHQINLCKTKYIGELENQLDCIENVQNRLAVNFQKDYLR